MRTGMIRSAGFLATGALACALVASPLAAEEHMMRPGEYEMTTQMKMEGMGREVPPSTYRHCFTAEDVKDGKRIAQGNQQKNGDCEVRDMKMSGGHGSWSMVCKSGAKGNVEMTYTGDGYDMTMNMETPRAGHGPMKMKMHTTAKRIGDCGK